MAVSIAFESQKLLFWGAGIWFCICLKKDEGRRGMAIPNLWRTQKQRYSLQGDVCVHCERAIFPPRQICPHCRRPLQEAAAPSVLFEFSALAVPAGLPAVLPAGTAGDD